jgi:hypothetical protein
MLLNIEMKQSVFYCLFSIRHHLNIICKWELHFCDRIEPGEWKPFLGLTQGHTPGWELCFQNAKKCRCSLVSLCNSIKWHLLTFVSTTWREKNKTPWSLVIVACFLCQLDHAKGCPQTSLTIISGFIWKGIPEDILSNIWIGKVGKDHLTKEGGYHPAYWGPEQNKNVEKGGVALCPPELFIWDMDLPLPSVLLVIRPSETTGIYTIGSPVLRLLNCTTGFLGSWFAEGRLWDFSASTTAWTNTLQWISLLLLLSMCACTYTPTGSLAQHGLI